MYKKLALILISVFTSACASAVGTPTPTATPFTPLSRGTPLPLMYQQINPDTASSVTLLSRWNVGIEVTQPLVFMQNDNTLLVGAGLWHIKDGSPDYSYSRREYSLGVNSNSPFGSLSPWVVNSPDGEFNIEDYLVDGIYIVDRNLETSRRLNYHHVGGSNGLIFTPDSRYLVIGMYTGKIWFVSTKDWAAKIKKFSPEDSYDLRPEKVVDVGAIPEDIAFSQDGSTMAVAIKDHTVQIWDVSSLSHRLTIKDVDKSANLAFSPDSQIIAAGLANHQIGLWDTHSGQSLTQLRGSKGVLRSIAFSPSGLYLASLDDKEGVLVWGILPRSNSVAAATTATAVSHSFSSTLTALHPLPTPSPTRTLISTATIYDFPAWTRTSDTPILAASISDDIKNTQQIFFFNAATGEKFEMVTPMEFSEFFWYDNMNFGMIPKDLNTSYKFNLQSGRVSAETIPAHLTTREFTEQFTGFRPGNMSFGKTFDAEWTDDNQAIKVIDTHTEQTVWQLPLANNRYGTELLWSRANESHLAFLQGSPDDLNGFITKDMTLTIVDVADGKVLATFSGDFGDLEWSPDGKMILYLNASFRYRNYGIPFQDAPCILFLSTGEKRCLRSIPRVIPTGYKLLTTGVYEWANDSNSIFYTYVYSLPSRWDILGNLCIYSLIDSHINCPTQNLDALKGRSIVFYYPSPNEQYIYFCYSASTILNDYADTANDGIIKIDGTNFFSWIGLIQDGGPQSCSDQTLWRPPA